MTPRPLLFALVAYAGSAAGFTFAEGTSSPDFGAPAQVSSRAYTIYTRQEACARSPVPGSLSVRLSHERISVGTRVHRTMQSELIVEAYDERGEFLPTVPIVVDVIADGSVIGSRGDWDYFVALAPGEVEVRVQWFCGSAAGSVHFSVSTE